jgi:hypothetical protein
MPQCLGSIAASGILDARSSRAATKHVGGAPARNELLSIRISNSPPCADTASRSRGRIRPSFILNIPPSFIRGRRECRAPDAPAAACAKVVVESTRVSQVTPESPGIPHAMVLTVSFVLSPATGFLATVAPEKLVSQELDTSIGVSGPHDFSVRFSTVRQERIRVHRIPPRVRNDREPPLGGTGRASHRFDLPDGESEIFL